MKKVQGHSNLYKTESGAVITTDWKVYEKAKERKLKEKRVDELENRLDKIEYLLERILDGQKKT